MNTTRTINASIVTYLTPPDELKKLIDSLESSPVHRIYVIDHSPDTSIKSCLEGNDRIIYHHEENLGYGRGHNYGIAASVESGADYHLVVNPDVYWTDPVIQSLADYMDANPDCGLVMPKILYPDGETQYLCKMLPSPTDLIVRRFIPVKGVRRRLNTRYELRGFDYDTPMEVPSLSGCFMFMRCSVLRNVGYFDPRFFMYAEDLDLCRRIGSQSKTVFYPKVSVYHAYAKGSYHNRRLLRYHLNSTFKYFNKWGWLFDSERRRRNRECQKLIDVLCHKI